MNDLLGQSLLFGDLLCDSEYLLALDNVFLPDDDVAGVGMVLVLLVGGVALILLLHHLAALCVAQVELQVVLPELLYNLRLCKRSETSVEKNRTGTNA
jgi:hypothetical protein